MLSLRTATGRFLLTFVLAVGLALCLGQPLLAKDVSGKLHPPDSNMTQIITLNDGSTLIGRITKVEAGTVVFSTKIREMWIPAETITDIKEVKTSSFREGRYWFPNPNQTILYISPTARMLKKGQGYFSDLLIFFPSVAYGITDNISLGAGCSILPGIDFQKQVYYLIPKIGFSPSPNISVAASGLIARVPDIGGDNFDTPKSMGLVFVTGTIGSEDNNLTAGLGDGWVGDHFADNPAIIIGGEYRVARRMSLVTENWKFPEVSDPIVSYGVRFFGENLAVDLALFNVLGEDAFFPGIPMVGFIYNF